MESTLEEVEKFATKLERASERVFKSASIWNTEPKAGAADPKIVAVLLLTRTLSNFRSTVILLRADRIVEARTVARAASRTCLLSQRCARTASASYWKWPKTIERAGKPAPSS